MNSWRLGVERRRSAAVLLAVAWLAWLHHWSPLILAGALLVWIIVQRHVDAGHGQRLQTVWRRVWRPHPAILLGLMTLGAMTFVLDGGSVAPKVTPIALHALALSVLVLGAWWRAFPALPSALGGNGVNDPKIRNTRSSATL